MIRQIIINNIPTLISFFIIAIALLIKYVTKMKQAKIVLEGHARLIEFNMRLEYETLENQKKYIKESCDILYNRYYEIFCKNMNVQQETRRAKLYRVLVLNEVRKLTDEIFVDACVVNGMLEKNEQEWKKYKNLKYEYILTQTIAKTYQVFIDEIIGFSHEEVIVKCRKDIISAYNDMIYDMLDELRAISEKNKNIINKNKKQIAELEKLVMLPKSDKIKFSDKNGNSIEL